MNKLASQTCPVCKGKKELYGRLVYEGDASGGIPVSVAIQCNECGGVGVVPAAGDLTQWREEMEQLIDHCAW
ncbi:hypothetical protein LCGC14_2342080, partial [marine sediment metagenome]